MKKIIIAKDIITKFGDYTVHDKVSFTVNHGEIYGLLGGSGSGKTTLLREMILLQKLYSGSLSILGKNIVSISEEDTMQLRLQWGVLFQFGALFSSLNVLENVMIPFLEYTKLSKKIIKKIAYLKLEMVGLDNSVASLYPSELSGGMKKRVGLARAIALDPKLLFLDEPSSGLDPSSAKKFDELILKLKQALDISIIIVTHDKETIKNVLDRFLILENKKVEFEGNFLELESLRPELLKRFME